MERRAFLTLLASAPIAALAPLPKVLAGPAFKTGTAVAAAMRQLDASLMFHPKAFAMMWPEIPKIDVIYGRGFLRRGENELHEIIIDSIPE